MATKKQTAEEPVVEKAPPQWKMRRRAVWISLAMGAIMCLSSVVLLWNDKLDTGNLIAGGVSLIAVVVTAYIGGATYEDVKMKMTEVSSQLYDGDGR